MARFSFLVNLLALWLFCQKMQTTTSSIVKHRPNPSDDSDQLFLTTHNNKKYDDYKPIVKSSEKSDYLARNTLEEYEDYTESETPRGMRVGLLNYGNRNMTMNLSSLVVLGLGMAAAVSLFSHFDSPPAFFKKRSADDDDDKDERTAARTVMDIFQYATLLNENSQKEESSDEIYEKNLNVSKILEDSIEGLCKLGILCYEDGRLDIGQPSVDDLDEIRLVDPTGTHGKDQQKV